MKLLSHASTDVGCVREHNEDDSLILPDAGVYVVADGMGGHACGEVASSISVESIANFYTNENVLADLAATHAALRKEPTEAGGCFPGDFPRFRIRSALEHANHQIYEEACKDPSLEDMGTTIVALAFGDEDVYVAHVGDSRAYRLRAGELQQLTEDHSLANEFIRMNILKVEDLPKFPYKNVIVRALGLQGDVIVDTGRHHHQPGDRYLLCSDGLSDLVADDEIAQILQDNEAPQSACAALVARALHYGGVDNVTVLVVDRP